MNSGNSFPRNLIVVFIVFAVVFIVIELLLNRGADGALLLTLTVFTMVVQGCIALAAVGEVAKGLWLIPVKRELLSVYVMLPFLALLLVVLGFRMDIYAWTEHPNGWLNVKFFIGRNVVLLLLTFWVAHKLARAVINGDPSRVKHGVVYLMLWVTSISLVAFDWIMSLESPWVSTLLGGYFFIQSFLMALIVTSYLLFMRMRRGEEGLTESLKDTAKMIFSFCFMWGGFMIAQYLVIWYGNIPEEVGYVQRRVDPAPYWVLSRAVLFMVFVVPFLGLLSREIKSKGLPVAVIASVAMAGLVLEKIILITPVVSINPIIAVAEFLLMIAMLVLVVRSRDSFLPQPVTTVPGEQKATTTVGRLAPENPQ